MTDDDRELNPHEKAAETKKRKTRAKIMVSAEFAVEEHGWNLRMDDVAADAGVSPTTLYTFFRNKSDLFAEMFNEKLFDALMPYAEEPQSTEDAARTRAKYLRALVDAGRNNRELIRGMLIGRAESEWTSGIDRIAQTLERCAFNRLFTVRREFAEQRSITWRFGALAVAIMDDILIPHFVKPNYAFGPNGVYNIGDATDPDDAQYEDLLNLYNYLAEYSLDEAKGRRLPAD